MSPTALPARGARRGMWLAVLGSGSAVPDPTRGNPSQAVVVDDEIFLFDCGERTTVNLVRVGINPLDVDVLFFTHLHWDHIADFGYLAMSSWNCGRRRELPVLGPRGTARMVESSIHGVHAADVDFVRAYVEALPPQVVDRPPADPPFTAQELDVGFVYETERARVVAGAVEHHQRLGMPSVGFRVESEHGVVAITGDTAPCDGAVELARGADVLVHDAAFLEEIVEERGMWSHSSPSGAGTTAEAAGVGTLVLTHLGPYTSDPAAVEMAAMYYGGRRPDGIWEEIGRRARSRFDGEVVVAHDALVLHVGGPAG